MSSELGQYYCWNGQYHEAITHLEQCSKAHSNHTSSEQAWYDLLIVNLDLLWRNYILYGGELITVNIFVRVLFDLIRLVNWMKTVMMPF
jgi:hypothetical protein